MISKFALSWIAAFPLLVAPLGDVFAQPTPQAVPQPASPVTSPTVKPLPFVSPIFGDKMVLQRGKVNTIWGWSEPGDKVQVQIGEQTASGVAGPDHRWQVKIQPPPVGGGPYTVKITGHKTVELHDVLVGDVWLCGGQSNMGLPLSMTRNGAEEAKTANYPEIRFFTVGGHSAYHHTDTIEGRWSEVSPQTANWLSATAYYFARKVQRETHVPIGLLLDNMGGTPAESWTSAEALHTLRDFDLPLAEVQRLAASGAPEYGNFVMHWYDEFDIGLKGKWASPDLDDSSWKPVNIPGGFAELGVPSTPALVWFRKEIVLPNPLPSGRTMLFLGSIERMDTVYINGKEVGGSSWVENPRVYPLFGAVLKPGKNVIAIRVLKTKPNGGFLSKAEDLHLVLGDKTSIPLAGEWKGRISVDARPPHSLPIAYENWPIMPTVLYKGMLAPIAPVSIAGAIWYQGEQNSERGYQYRKLLPVMIADWRKLFAQGDFPFYIVSLPAFKQRSPVPVEGDAWAETRESQALTASSVPNSCLAVTIDTGDANNIHSPDKLQVGERLALCARANYYGEKVVFSGPTLASVERLPDSIRLHFAHTDGGLVVKGAKLEEFSIAGEDRKWHWADARIDGDTIVVSSASVPNPKEVRYAWQSNPAATLFNGAGLPAGPFRTDNWPGITDSQRPY
jgi:sialate O-acetylesterase